MEKHGGKKQGIVESISIRNCVKERKTKPKKNDKHSKEQNNNSRKHMKEKRAKRNTIKQSKSSKKHMKEKEIKIREKTKVARQVSKERSEFCPFTS